MDNTAVQRVGTVHCTYSLEISYFVILLYVIFVICYIGYDIIRETLYNMSARPSVSPMAASAAAAARLHWSTFAYLLGIGTVDRL